jgi:hypothetical protein
VKFSVRQILASAAGAVIAALIASAFGVKGTIIGVAIGSAAATAGTAFFAQSIDRGHQAVKQVAERVPDSSASSLLRRLGGTGAKGDAASSVDASSAPTEVVGSGRRTGSGAAAETAQTERTAGETQRMEVSASPDTPATQRVSASTMPMPRVTGGNGPARSGSTATTSVTSSASGAPLAPRRYTWKAIAAAAGIVFVLALLFITAVELISGKPLSDIFGGAGSGTTFGNIINPGPAPTSTTTSTTPTSTTSTSTTTSSSTPTSTSTTAPAGQSTTTTSAPPTSTTTTNAAGSGTTTTAPRSSTSP